MIVTALDMYDAFLSNLNKDKTGTVFPEEFEILINQAQMEYVKNKYDAVEVTEKRIDDLREIIVLNEIIANTGANISGQELFQLPYSATGFISTPKNPSGDNHGYLFMLRCAMQIKFVNSPCKQTGLSDYRKTKVMSSDKHEEILRDPFNKPTEERLYYQTTGDAFICFTGTQSYGVSAEIDYLRYPRDIKIIGVPVDCELSIHGRQEIVDIAVRKKLQQIESPRYPGNVNEGRQVVT